MIKKLILLGPPGIGKGTLAKKLANEKKIIHISTGDIFRREIQEKSSLGLKVEHFLNAGEYVPDQITNAIVKKAILSPKVIKHGFILDGFPRTKEQAQFLQDQKIEITNVILLEAQDKEVMKRLLNRAQQENRKDDTPEVVANRVRVYQQKTAPLISWYHDQGLLNKVDASGNIENNYQGLLEALYD